MEKLLYLNDAIPPSNSSLTPYLDPDPAHAPEPDPNPYYEITIPSPLCNHRLKKILINWTGSDSGSWAWARSRLGVGILLRE